MSHFTSRRTPPDANTFLCWKLDEANGSTVFKQTGVYSIASDLTLTNATGSVGDTVLVSSFDSQFIKAGRPGIVTPNAVDFISATTFGSTNCYLKSASVAHAGLSTTAFSVHGWYKAHTFPGSGEFARLITQWTTTSGTSPSGAPDNFAILLNQTTGNIYMQMNSLGTTLGSNFGTAGTNNLIRDPFPLHQWVHIAVTFNSGSVIIYLNGAPVAVQSLGISTAHWASSGPWSLGGSPVSLSGCNGEMNDWRVENGVRSPAYFRSLVYRAIAR